MSAEELHTKHPWLNRYRGELIGWNRLIDELACQIERRYADHGQPLNAETFRIRQVKQKLGELRLYCDSSVPIQDLIQQGNQPFGLAFVHCLKPQDQQTVAGQQSGRAMRGRCVKGKDQGIRPQRAGPPAPRGCNGAAGSRSPS